MDQATFNLKIKKLLHQLKISSWIELSFYFSICLVIALNVIAHNPLLSQASQNSFKTGSIFFIVYLIITALIRTVYLVFTLFFAYSLEKYGQKEIQKWYKNQKLLLHFLSLFLPILIFKVYQLWIQKSKQLPVLD